MYALSDPSGKHDLSELRSLQDWFLKYELQTVQGVSEVATVGGMVKQYQVIVDPHKLQAYNIPLSHIQLAIQQGNSETGASVIEMAEAEYMIRTTGYIKRKSDIENIPIGLNSELDGTPLLIKNIADLELGPQMRRGLADLNGEGETVGGIVVMRFGENAQATINRVKSKLASLQGSLRQV
jgi:Cu(I)/Ag(I) efflux system membrane protein CusA/SilA